MGEALSVCHLISTLLDLGLYSTMAYHSLELAVLPCQVFPAEFMGVCRSINVCGYNHEQKTHYIQKNCTQFSPNIEKQITQGPCFKSTNPVPGGGGGGAPWVWTQTTRPINRWPHMGGGGWHVAYGAVACHLGGQGAWRRGSGRGDLGGGVKG